MNLTDTEITSDGLALLTKLPNLASLNVRATKVTDAGLVHLKDCPKLQALCLSSTSVTTEGIKRHLADCRNLKRLEAKYCQIDERLGTALHWADSIEEAAEDAHRKQKLVFVIHVSGNFKIPTFT